VGVAASKSLRFVKRSRLQTFAHARAQTFRLALRARYAAARGVRFTRSAESFSRKISIRSDSVLWRFTEHSGLFRLPPTRVRVVPRAAALLDEREFGGTYCPYIFDRLSASDTRAWNRNMDLGHPIWINSVFSRADWNQSYFHWHRNLLTHIAVLQELGLDDVNVIVSDQVPEYKVQSLLGLGVLRHKIVPWSRVAGTHVENLVFLTNLDRQSPPYPGDLVKPSALRTLASKLLEARPADDSGEKAKLYVKRGHGTQRSVLNETEVLDMLLAEGFRAVDPGAMSYWEQVSLFENASQVIAPHGAALTNIMFSTRPKLLEFAPAGHGARPDYFQFAAAVGGHYTMCVLPSENDQNDITIPPEVVRRWLRGGTKTQNRVFTLGD